MAFFQDYLSEPVGLTEVIDSEWQQHQLGHMQICTSTQTDNHAGISPLTFYQTLEIL